METEEQYWPLKDETDRILASCIEVHRHLGSGFLEIVYKDALEIEFSLRNISYEREKQYVVAYKQSLLKHQFFADFVVLNAVILEVKSKENIAAEDMAQTINYLKCSGCKVGLIINFGTSKMGIKRLVF